MLKAVVRSDTGSIIVIGLSRGNLEEFLNKMLDTYTPIDLGELDPRFDGTKLLILSGETEQDIADALQKWIPNGG